MDTVVGSGPGSSRSETTDRGGDQVTGSPITLCCSRNRSSNPVEIANNLRRKHRYQLRSPPPFVTRAFRKGRQAGGLHTDSFEQP